MPSHEARMTELEVGHFGSGNTVLDARRQQVNERYSTARFQSYIDIAKKRVPSGRWLDVGCGAGTLLLRARDAGYEPEGIELTSDRRATAAAATRLPIHAAPVENIRFADGAFSVISLIQVFSHLTAPSQTFKELRRILRPGGVMVVATSIIGDGAKPAHSYSWSLGEHLYFLGEGTMERYAQDTGFRVVEHRRQWAIDAYYTRERFALKGRSRKRNVAKTVILSVPGALPALRAAMRRVQSDNAVFPSVFALS